MSTPRRSTTPKRQTWMSMRSPDLFPAGLTITIHSRIGIDRIIPGITLLPREAFERRLLQMAPWVVLQVEI